MKKNLIQKNLHEQTGSLLKPYSVTFISNDEVMLQLSALAMGKKRS